jgi:CRP-like cAMP-binding protein
MDGVTWQRESPASARFAVSSASPKLEEALAAARKSGWLMGQPSDFTDQLLAHASLRQYRKKQLVIEFAEAGPGLHFLLRGSVDVWVPRLTGELFPVHLVPPLQWFGELGALTGRGCFAEYYARGASSALYIPRSAITSLEAASPRFRQAFLELLSLSIKDLMEKAGDLAGLDPERRVISKLVTLSGPAGEADEDEAGHVLPLSQAELAVVSCVSRAFMNAVLAKLEKAGILKLGYRRIVVLERRRLLAALRDER